MQILKANTNAVVKIGPAISIVDGYSTVNTLNIASGTDYAYVMKSDGTESSITGNTWAAVTTPNDIDGWYNLTLTAANLDKPGYLTVAILDADLCYPILKEFQVVREGVYDSLYGNYPSVIEGQVQAGAPGPVTPTLTLFGTGTTITTDYQTAGANALNGRVLIFDLDTNTATLRGQAATIVGFDTSGTITLAAGALTGTIAAGDKFKIY